MIHVTHWREAKSSGIRHGFLWPTGVHKLLARLIDLWDPACKVCNADTLWLQGLLKRLCMKVEGLLGVFLLRFLLFVINGRFPCCFKRLIHNTYVHELLRQWNIEALHEWGLFLLLSFIVSVGWMVRNWNDYCRGHFQVRLPETNVPIRYFLSFLVMSNILIRFFKSQTTSQHSWITTWEWVTFELSKLISWSWGIWNPDKTQCRREIVQGF